MTRHLLAVLLTLLPLTAHAGDALTSKDVARLRNVTEVAIAPGGDRVAYVLSVPRDPFDQKDGPAWAELHVLSAQGSARPFVTGEVTVAHVTFTPDGRSIAYLAKRRGDDHTSVYVIPVDGGESRRVRAHGSDIREIALSPDGRTLAFLATEPRTKTEKELRDQGFDQRVVDEDWLPVRLWTAPLAEPDAEARLVPLEGSATELCFSPAGDSVALALAPTPSMDDFYMRRTPTVVDLASGKVTASVPVPGKLGPFAVSPDGQAIAAVVAADEHDPAAGRLLVAGLKGEKPAMLLGDYEGHVRRVAWRDAQTIVYLADEGTGTGLFEIGRDGSGERTHLPAAGHALLAFDLARDGKQYALLGHAPTHPGEVFTGTLGRDEPSRRTDSNPWLAKKRLARQEVIRYDARDGLAIEALLIHPLDEKPGTKVPMILVAHGGPEGNYQNGWLTSYASPGQLAAARGFALLYPNYRGSTGRGVAFSKLSQGEPGGAEMDDLVDGVDHLIAQGMVDGAKVGITGGSYGGYATAWCSTRYTDRFAAGVMLAGISDKVSKVGTTDIPDEELLVHALRRPWEDWSFFLDRSPITHTEGARTPLLILHGDQDPRVDPEQSREMYRYLKLRGKAPVRLVLYRGEGHGNRRAASRLDYNLRMMRWLTHYLMGPGGAPPPYAITPE